MVQTENSNTSEKTSSSSGSNVTISLYVDNDFIQRVNKARGGIPRSSFIIQVVEEYLDKNGNGKGSL